MPNLSFPEVPNDMDLESKYVETGGLRSALDSGQCTEIPDSTGVHYLYSTAQPVRAASSTSLAPMGDCMQDKIDS